MTNKERFVEEHLQEEGVVSKYKERKKYGNYAGWGFLTFLLLISPLFAIIESFLDANESDTILMVLGTILIGFFLLTMVSSHYRMKSGLTDETIAYHDLACAIKSYERGSYDETLKHLHECKKFIKDYEVDKVSEKVRDALIEYIVSLEEAYDQEQEIKDTFDEVSSIFINKIMTHEHERIEVITKEIGQKSPAKLSGIQRAKSDIHQLIVRGVFGFWGIVIAAFVAGYFVFHFYSKVFGAGIIGTILTAYGIHQRRTE